MKHKVNMFKEQSIAYGFFLISYRQDKLPLVSAGLGETLELWLLCPIESS